MTLDPETVTNLLAPALGKGFKYVLWELGWLARGENGVKPLSELVGWGLTENSHVVDLVEDEPVGTDIVERVVVNCLLRLFISLAGRFVTGETGDAVVGWQLAATFAVLVMLTP
jgi:hypothetical protein